MKQLFSPKILAILLQIKIIFPSNFSDFNLLTTISNTSLILRTTLSNKWSQLGGSIQMNHGRHWQLAWKSEMPWPVPVRRSSSHTCRFIRYLINSKSTLGSIRTTDTVVDSLIRTLKVWISDSEQIVDHVRGPGNDTSLDTGTLVYFYLRWQQKIWVKTESKSFLNSGRFLQRSTTLCSSWSRCPGRTISQCSPILKTTRCLQWNRKYCQSETNCRWKKWWVLF